MLVLVTGGSASGKSELGEQLSVNLKTNKLYYIATMKAADNECRQRIEKHRTMRKGKGFCTIECSDRLYETAEQHTDLDGATALLDCLGNLLANEQFGVDGENAVNNIIKGIDALYQRLKNLVIVSNEIFTDGTEYDIESEKYIQNLAYIHRYIASKADTVVEMCCGIPIVHKGDLRQLRQKGYGN